MKFRPTVSSTLLVGLLATSASAQTFTLTVRQPTAVQAVGAAATGVAPAGRDFASEVIGDPWDFEQESDYNLMYSLRWDNPLQSAWVGRPQLVNGVFRGVAATPMPWLSLQFEGIAGGFNMAGRNGVRFPIDANRFRRLSVRVKRPPTTLIDDTMQVMWFNGITRTSTSAGGRLWPAAGYNGQANIYNNQMPAAQQGSGWQIYKVDLDRPGGVWAHGIPWANTMRGIQLAFGEPRNTALAGGTFEIDWVRLTERGVNFADLSFTGFGGPVTVTARHAETGDLIQITPDNGTNATTFPDNSTFQWDYGFLPPGTWVISATRNGNTVTNTLVVDAAPVVHVTDPDVSGGRDFAQSVIGDAWDMTNREDVTRHGRHYDMTGVSYGDAGMTGTTLGPGGEAVNEGDSWVAFVDDAITYPRERVIPADEYHRFTFTLEYLSGKELPGPIALNNDWGAVFRIIWRYRANGQNVPYSETLPIVMLDGGPHTFSMDLKTLTKSGPVEPSVEAWSPVLWTGEIGTLRVDVNEGKGVDRPFRISNVKLAADDEPNGSGFFLVRWRVADATFTRAVADTAGADATVSLFYNTSESPAGRQAIPGASNLPASPGQFAWNVASLPPGTYWVFAQITDAAGNAQLRPSTGPVRVRAGLVTPTDANRNGLSDAWEARHDISSPDGDEDGDGVSNLDEYRRGTDPRLSNRWILPEGATGAFSERLAMVNPNPEDATLTVTYLREGAPPVMRDYTVAGNSRLTVDVNSVASLADTAVSAVVTANTGGVVVERTMAWGNLQQGGHTGKALADARTKWYLAEGHAGLFDTFILLANANGERTQAHVSFLLEGGAPVHKSYDLGPNSRTTIYTNLIPELVGQAFSTTIESGLPITVERAMYFNTPNVQWDGGHGAAAVDAPATNWFVAEGCTAGMFDMFLLLANPGTAATTATVRYLLPSGQVVSRDYALPASSRTTVWVDQIPGLGSTDISASISAPLPIIVERAMYWGNGAWTDGHASAGVTATGLKWALAEGEHGGSRGYVTYILLANPNGTDATARVTLLRAAGLPPLTMNVVVPANARLTVSSPQFPLGDGERFGVIVESQNGVPIVVERAMYWNGGGRYWGAGTNETAFKLR